MKNWDIYFMSPTLIILMVAISCFFIKKSNLEKKWLSFFFQVFLTTTSSMIVVGSISNKTQSFSNNSTLGSIIIIILGSWLLFGSIFKLLYGFLSIKIKNRKLIIQIANLFLVLAILLSLTKTQNQALFVSIVVFQSIFVGGALGAQSIYFLFLNEQKFSKSFPLKTSFVIATYIVISYLFAHLFVNIENLFSLNFLKLDIYMALVFAIISFILSLSLKENKDKIGSFSTRVSYKMALYKKSYLVKLVLLTFLLGVIYAALQSPIMKLYLTALLKSKGVSDGNITSFYRQYNLIFLLPQVIMGYVAFKMLNTKINVNYVLILILGLSSTLFFINTFFINAWFLIISIFIFGSLFFTMLYFWFGFSLMWNSRTKNTPITAWVAWSLLMSQFLTLAFSFLVILLNNSIFPIKDIESVLSSTSEQISVFIIKMTSFLKLFFASIFALNSIYSILCFMWMNQLVAEYSDLNTMIQRMYKIQKESIERKINRRMVVD